MKKMKRKEEAHMAMSTDDMSADKGEIEDKKSKMSQSHLSSMTIPEYRWMRMQSIHQLTLWHSARGLLHTDCLLQSNHTYSH